MMEINLMAATVWTSRSHVCATCAGACEACCYAPMPSACPWCPDWDEAWLGCEACTLEHLREHGAVSPARFRAWLRLERCEEP